jgi:hypothetical protein
MFIGISLTFPFFVFGKVISLTNLIKLKLKTHKTLNKIQLKTIKQI